MDSPASRFAIYGLLAVVLGAVAYGGTLFNGFVWDDRTLILENRYVHDLGAWPEYFSTAESISADPVLSKMYRPLQTLSLAIDRAIWDDRAGGFHLTSLLLHLLCSVAILFAFRPLVGPHASGAAGVIFAVHPALSEAVLGLASRGNQLSVLFALLAVGFFARTRVPFDRPHGLALAATALALLSKEPAVMLVVLLPLLRLVDERPLPRASGMLRLYAPVAVLVTVYLVVRTAVTGAPTVMDYWGGSLWATVLMQAKVFAAYWGLLLWPFTPRARYVISEPGPFPDLAVVAAVLLSAALIALAFVVYRRGRGGRLLSVGLLRFYVSLAPLSNVIPIPGSMMGERFLYLPFAGLLPLLAAACLPHFARIPRALLLTAGVGLLGAWIATDIARTPDWRDNRTFFEVLVRQLPEDPIAHVCLAQEELTAGEPLSALRRLEPLTRIEVMSPFPKSQATIHFWYGRALLATGDPRLAGRHLARAAEIYPSREATLFLAEALALSGELSRARDLLEQQLSESPRDDDALNGLANVLWMMGDETSAASMYREVLEINPDHEQAAANLRSLER